ncbi:hypothetical protein EJ08DRAFT_402202 [Tothia fuscella]|uniref:F-box domain-containing protein n=1 Tax=Tothia fuscella TaxID=1048955 RepID=A0A9P4TVL4_9PEZI|nr:hypothetical protein EJ08DRAFT_402202 [Tothia fuscella]
MDFKPGTLFAKKDVLQTLHFPSKLHILSAQWGQNPRQHQDRTANFRLCDLPTEIQQTIFKTLIPPLAVVPAYCKILYPSFPESELWKSCVRDFRALFLVSKTISANAHEVLHQNVVFQMVWDLDGLQAFGATHATPEAGIRQSRLVPDPADGDLASYIRNVRYISLHSEPSFIVKSPWLQRRVWYNS